MLRVRPRGGGVDADVVATNGDDGEQSSTRPLNLAATLDLGATLYRTFHGRAYRVPALPVTIGEQLLDAWLTVQEVPSPLTRASMPVYYGALRRMRRLAWRAVRPVGLARRALRTLGLHRNPFDTASEGELLEWVAFLLRRRTSASGPVYPAAMAMRADVT